MITLFRKYLFKNHYRLENIHIFFLKIKTNLCKTLKNLITLYINLKYYIRLLKKHHKDVSQDDKFHKKYITYI